MNLQTVYERLLRHVARRAAVRRADRILRASLRRPNPGYDELIEPVFVLVMLAAVAALVFDLRAEGQQVLAWVQSVIDAVRAWA